MEIGDGKMQLLFVCQSLKKTQSLAKWTML